MRVLIVSPHFPPTNAADMQRVRLLLPYFPAEGVSAEVLCVDAAQVAAPADPWLVAGLPQEVAVHRVQALGLQASRIPGLGTLTFRALGALRRRGNELLRRGGFDLVYFSTTQFGIHVLGPEWRKRFGVPFAMDYQDPWVSDYYREHPEVRPPGGKWKYAAVTFLSRRQEPQVLRHCSGITSVSPAYPVQLAKRYPWLPLREASAGSSEHRGLPCLVAPFPGDERDFDRVKAENIRQTVFDPRDGRRHWVYVGRGGTDMQRAVRAIFGALGQRVAARPQLTDRLRLHFIGTSYAAAGTGTKTIEPLAGEYGLGGIVQEHPTRIPYSETLRCLLDADALIVPGSDDPAYTASKIYPYLLARRPLLAVFHRDSSVHSLLAKVGGGHRVAFASEEAPSAIAARILDTALDEDAQVPPLPLDQSAFAAYTAREQARRLTRFFEECLATGRRPSASDE